MSYKPDESVLMAYLYDELSAEERAMVEIYLQENPAAMKELESIQHVRKMLSSVSDKEVIAPPIVVEDTKQRYFWNAPYFKTISAIAASLLLLMVAGKLMDMQVNFSDNELKLSFGKSAEKTMGQSSQGLTAEEVQSMINSSMEQNNQFVQASLNETQKKLDASISKNLAANSLKINDLVQQASQASQDDLRRFVASLQDQNQQVVKDYFQLSVADQQKYIEGLLVDFSKYLQQQRTNDLETIQTRLTGIEQNTSVFKQETEQILASIISSNNSSSTSNNY
ncbi:MAG TPA: hypothetical protein VGK39_02280 [Cyclobacteriaceae bacterium]